MKARSDVRETVADLSSKYTRAPCYLHSEDTPSTQPPKDKFFTGDKEMPPKPFNGCSFDKIKQGFCRPAKEPCLILSKLQPLNGFGGISLSPVKNLSLGG